MNIDTAQISRIGDRAENQDRAAILISDSLVLLAVADGMGGHTGGADAAQAAITSLTMSFKNWRGRKSNTAFLNDALNAAHKSVFELGAALPPSQRPRTTCTVCLVDDDVAQWAHIGDSRAYWLDATTIKQRTRDHSEVEALYQCGAISDAEALTHPRRNFVDRCLGGDAGEPSFEIAPPVDLASGDTLLLCTDGLWGALNQDQLLVAMLNDGALDAALTTIVDHAEQQAHPVCDNVTAAALRWTI